MFVFESGVAGRHVPLYTRYVDARALMLTLPKFKPIHSKAPTSCAHDLHKQDLMGTKHDVIHSLVSCAYVHVIR